MCYLRLVLLPLLCGVTRSNQPLRGRPLNELLRLNNAPPVLRGQQPLSPLRK